MNVYYNGNRGIYMHTTLIVIAQILSMFIEKKSNARNGNWLSANGPVGGITYLQKTCFHVILWGPSLKVRVEKRKFT